MRTRDQAKRLEEQLKEVEATVRTAEKKLDELQRVAETARRKEQQYRGQLSDEGWPIVKAIINFPLFDFAAPKNTPSRYVIP